MSPEVEDLVNKLGPLQQRIVVHEQLEPNGPRFNIGVDCRIQGDFDGDRLRRALQGVSWGSGSGVPEFLLFPAGDSVDLLDVDLSDQPRETAEALARDRMEAEVSAPIALGQDALVSSTLFRISASEHWWFLRCHHIVTDGLGLFNLLRLVASAYSGKPHTRPEQVARASQEFTREQCLSYWQGALADLPESLLRRREQSPELRTHAFVDRISTETHSGLAARGLSVPHAVRWALSWVGARLSPSGAVAVGMASHGRTPEQIHQVLGMHARILPVQFHSEEARSIRTSLATLASSARDAYRHQDVDPSALVRTAGLDPTTQHLLSEISFNYLDLDLGLVFGTCSGEVNFVLNRRAPGPVQLRVYEWGSHRDPEVVLYCEDRFLSAKETERLGQRVMCAVEQLARLDLDATESEMKLLLPGERTLLLALAGKSRVDVDGPVGALDRFESLVRTAPEAPALCHGDQTLSYREVDERSNALAHVLVQRGVGPEALVGICLPRGIDSIVAVLATLKAGGAFLPLDPSYPEARLQFMVSDARPKVVISHDSLASALPLRDLLLLESVDWREGRHVAPRRSYSPESLAYVIYTSGSTGQPKGVLLEHRGLDNLVAEQGAILEVGPGQRILQFAAQSFDAFVWEVFMALGHGATLCLASSDALLPGPTLAQTIEELAVDVVTLPPVALELLTRFPLRSLRTVVVAGEACSAELVSHFAGRLRLFNAYGPTEATVCSTIHRCQTGASGPPPIGRALGNVRTYVVDERGQLLPFGAEGELVVGGVSVARGYLHRKELTEERFVSDPIDPRARAYRTGDRVRFREDGQLEFLGRFDSQIKIRGHRIELGEVEAVLRRLSLVRDAVAIARGEGSGRALLAFVLCDDANAVNISALRDELMGAVPSFMIPSQIVPVEAFPMTPAGKVDRSRLALWQATTSSHFLAPRDEIEAFLCSAWASALHIDAVGAADNVFHLGAHSLLASAILVRAKERFGVELRLRDVFDAPTVEAFAGRIRAAKPQQDGAAELPIYGGSGQVLASPAQQGLWFLNALDPDSSAYNMSLALRLRGPLDLGALRAAIHAVVTRHEALRTRFGLAGEQIFQVTDVEPSAVLQDFPASEEEPFPQTGPDSARAVEAFARRPFDLSQGPLFRALVLREDEGEHLLAFSLHHSIADGWSIQVLVEDLVSAYLQRKDGEIAPSFRPVRSFRDYCEWQRVHLSDERRREQRDFWIDSLAGAPPLLDLPTDSARTGRAWGPGDSLPLELSAELSAHLSHLAQTEECTVFMVLAAAFNLLLSRFSGQKDICLGTVAANREHPEFQRTIGYFSSTLVLRTLVDETSDFRQLLRQVRETTLDIQAHQDLSFHEIVEAVNPTRSAHHAPLFQVMLAFQQAPAELKFPGFKIEHLELAYGDAKYDLALNLVQTANGLRGAFEYRRDLFAASTITRWASDLVDLLSTVCRVPESPLGELALASAREEPGTLVRRAPALLDQPRPLTFLAGFEERARMAPERAAVEFEGKVLSFFELDRAAGRLAQVLKNQGARPESVVAIRLPRSVELVVAILAVWKAGAAYLPLDPDHPLSRTLDILTDAEACCVVSSQPLAELEQEGRPIVPFSSVEDLQGAPLQSAALPDPEHLAYVLYTSGSTGRPKGVEVEHRSLVNMACAHLELIHRPFGLSEMRTSLNAAFTFDAFLSELSLLLDGHTLVIIPDDIRRSPRQLARFLQEERIDAFDSSPAQLKALLPHTQGQEMPRIVVFGGEAADHQLWQELVRRSGSCFVNAYGPTECTVDVTLCFVHEHPQGPAIGRPIPNVSIDVLDEAQRPVPVGALGELWVTGDSVARGYRNQLEITKERFFECTTSPVFRTRTYRTGDLGRRLADGTIEFVGRRDEQVKLRGYRVEPGEVEAALCSIPGVRSAHVCPSQMGGHAALAAYVVREPASSPPPEGDLAGGVLEVLDVGNAPPFARIYRVTTNHEEVAVVQWTGAPMVQSQDGARFAAVPLGTVPYLRRDFDALHAGSWPAYFEGAKSLSLYWEQMYERFPEAQILLRSIGRKTVGVGNTVLIHWNGEQASIPKGWEGALRAACQPAGGATQPNTMVILAGIIDPRVQARGLASLLIQALKDLAATLGMERLLIAARPIGKANSRNMPLSDYASLRNDRGELVDGWLRLHERLGGKLVAIEEESQLVEGSIADWERWSGAPWTQSEVVLPTDLLANVKIDWTQKKAIYQDPCVWFVHELAPDGASHRAPTPPEATRAYERISGEVPHRTVILADSAEATEAADLPAILHDLARYSQPLLAPSQLRQKLASQLPDYMVPALWGTVQGFELTSAGKVDRSVLPPALAPMGSEAESIDPRTPLEEKVAGIWREVLGVDRVSVRDDFFQLGGHSLLATAVLAKINAQLSVALELRSMFEHPTVEGLALAVTGLGAGAATAVEANLATWREVSPNLSSVGTPGARRPVIYVPGAGASASAFHPVGEHLVKAGVQVIAVLHDGIDNSSAPLQSLEDMVERYAEQLAPHCPEGGVFLGFCSGGLLALEVAERLRERMDARFDLIFLDATIPSPGEPEPIDMKHYRSEFFKAICDTYARVPEEDAPPEYSLMTEGDCADYCVKRMGVPDPKEEASWRQVFLRRYDTELAHEHAVRAFWRARPDRVVWSAAQRGHDNPYPLLLLESEEARDRFPDATSAWRRAGFNQVDAVYLGGRHNLVFKQRTAEMAEAILGALEAASY